MDFVGFLRTVENIKKALLKMGENKFLTENKTNFVTRLEWKGLSPRYPALPLEKLPSDYVIISHAASSFCQNTSECIEYVQEIQLQHMEIKKMSDIGYNFLVGGDGLIYEGRGWDVAGNHTEDWNNNSIGICFIGNYNVDHPSLKQIQAIKKFLNLGVNQINLSNNYTLLGQSQIVDVDSPGKNLYDIITTFSHWKEIEIKDLNIFVNRTEWKALESKNPLVKFQSLPKYVIVMHTASNFCRIKESCIRYIQIMQRDYMNLEHFDDIPYNFLVGGNGEIYEGRGWDYIGTHTDSWNTRSIGIAFIGDYDVQDQLTITQIHVTKKFLEYNVVHNKIDKNYVLLGQNQVLHNTISPGGEIYKEIKTWKHWREKQIDDEIGYLTRTEWKASPPKKPNTPFNDLPRYVIIIHTPELEACFEKFQCINSTRSIQSDHMKLQGLNDVAYNFLVGGDGDVMIYEGRGWDAEGDHTEDWNSKSLGISFIGNYNRLVPEILQLNATKNLLDIGVRRNKLAEDYIILGQRQVSSTSSPGDNLYRAIKKWDHWKELGIGDQVDFVSHLEWEFMPPITELVQFNNLPEYVIFIHTNSKFCETREECIRIIEDVQKNQMNVQKKDGIAYNFLIGGDGAIYEGRGWNFVGDHTDSWNTRSIGIAFIGDYEVRNNLTNVQIDAVKKLLEFSVVHKKIDEQYVLFAQNQLLDTDSPGKKVYNEIKTWKHWRKKQTEDEIGYLTRTEWKASSPKKPLKPFNDLVKYVIITESPGAKYCLNKLKCINSVQSIQKDDKELRKLDDIAYNFVVGADVLAIYEGRGWDFVGAHTDDWNSRSIGISYIGNYDIFNPRPNQLSSTKFLLDLGVRQNKLDKDYVVFAQKQVSHYSYSPGRMLYDAIKKWDHWRGLEITDERDFVPRLKWEATAPERQPVPFQTRPKLVIIIHTNSKFCYNRRECIRSIQDIQKDHIKLHGKSDVTYNFLIAGDGAIYEGRGWDFVGEHTKSFDEFSLGIAFVGNYNVRSATDEQLAVTKKLLEIAVNQKKLEEDYKLVGQKQVSNSDSDSPGRYLYSSIVTWKHFVFNYTQI